MYETRTYELAGIGERFIALLIDGIVLSIVGGIFGANGGGFIGSIAGFVVGVGYHWYFLTQQNGQTLGKMALNIRVVKVDGAPIRDADAVLRYIGYYINTPLLMLGWLWAFFDPQNQGWHDKIAQTYVVKAEDKSKTVDL